jgi:hypothetical protein
MYVDCRKESSQNKVPGGCYLLQGLGKMLLKLYKGLSAAEADPYLTGLCKHSVTVLCMELGQHLRELQSSHKLLRSRLQEAIVPAFWGVLQHSFNLHLEVRAMKHGLQVNIKVVGTVVVNCTDANPTRRAAIFMHQGVTLTCRDENFLRGGKSSSEPLRKQTSLMGTLGADATSNKPVTLCVDLRRRGAAT